MTEGESITVSAVFAAREGASAIAGGALLDETSGATVASFQTAGSSSLDAAVTWKALHAANAIQIATGATSKRTLRARFFDGEGRKTERTLSVELTCSSNAACDGKCVDTSESREHCGVCGRACPLNQAGYQSRTFCIDGACAPALAACTVASSTATCDEICQGKGKTCATTCFDGTQGGVAGSNAKCDGSWATPNCGGTIGSGYGFTYASCCCI